MSLQTNETQLDYFVLENEKKSPYWLARAKSVVAQMSLSKRMFALTALTLLVFLSVATLVLRTAFWISLENIAQEKLSLHIYRLISMADSSGNTIELPRETSEEKFNSSAGELFGFVKKLGANGQQKEVWRSISADEKSFSFPVPNSGEWLFGRARGDNGDKFYVSSFTTTWSNGLGSKDQYVFTVMEDFSYYEKQIAQYRTSISIGLVVFGAVFLLLQFFILRFGLRPVKRITVDVERMNKGESNWLEGKYPKELIPLTLNLNRLIDKERHQRDRYRERMADLSHGFKTPLSVLKGLNSDIDEDGKPISREEILKTLENQVSRMSKLVDYQLQRSISSGAPTVLSKVNVANNVSDIVAALDKVYLDKGITFSKDINADLLFYGDENDLIEMVGNLLDNAYKHATNRVRFSASKSKSKADRTELTLIVEDDGSGVPAKKRSSILKRGVQLDSAGDGQGFGLSIVADIVRNYEGTLAVKNSSLGGALFEIIIPTV